MSNADKPPDTERSTTTTPATTTVDLPCVTTAVTMTCDECGTTFTPSGRRRYCSNKCRQTAWRQRHNTPVIPIKLARHETIYLCPDCNTRYLGTQRCPDCNTFCTTIGPGAPCPHCDEPVAINDLITTTNNTPRPQPV